MSGVVGALAGAAIENAIGGGAQPAVGNLQGRKVTPPLSFYAFGVTALLGAVTFAAGVALSISGTAFLGALLLGTSCLGAYAVKDLSSMDDQIKTLQSTVNTMKETKKGLERAKEGLEKDLKEARRVTEETQAAFRDGNAKLAKETKELEESQGKLAASLQRLQDLQAYYDKLAKTPAKIQGYLDEYQKGNIKLAELEDKLTARQTKLSTAASDLTHEGDELEDNIKAFDRNNAVLTTLILELVKNLAQAKSLQDIAQGDVASLKEQNATLKKQVEDLSEEAKHLDKIAKQLHAITSTAQLDEKTHAAHSAAASDLFERLRKLKEERLAREKAAVAVST